MPLGQALIEIGTAGCLFSLLIYYATSYEKSNLKRYDLKPIVFMFVFYILVNAIFLSIDPWEYFRPVSIGVYKCLLFLFVGLEFVRCADDLKKLVFAFCVPAVYEGLDGVYQYAQGVDLLRHTEAVGGRLTGTLSTPRVGNLMSLLLPIAASSLLLFQNIRSYFYRMAIGAFILVPPAFLLYGSKTRSGWIGVLVSLFAFLYITTKVKLNTIFLIGLSFVLFIMFLPGRLNIETVLSDPRIELWETCVAIFKQYPVFGSGFHTFAKAFNSLGIVLAQSSQHIPHPHNIYMQFLAEGGVIGILLLLLFLFGNLFWSAGRIKKMLANPSKDFFLLAFFWSSYAGYLATAISAHNFFRQWWLGMAMSILGITLGGCLVSPQEQSPLEM